MRLLPGDLVKATVAKIDLRSRNIVAGDRRKRRKIGCLCLDDVAIVIADDVVNGAAAKTQLQVLLCTKDCIGWASVAFLEKVP